METPKYNSPQFFSLYLSANSIYGLSTHRRVGYGVRRHGERGSEGTLPRGPLSWQGPGGDQISASFEVFSNLTRKICKFFDFGVND